MAQKRGLGRGLGAIIPGDLVTATAQADLYIPISMVVPNPHQPRGDMDAANLGDLAASIKEHGILQPLIVSHDPVSGMYTLIAGERRLRAARIAGLEKVPVIIRSVSEQERLELALIENLQRDDLSPLETARAYQELSDAFNLSHDEIATRMGKSRATVTNTLRLLKLPETIQRSLADARITEGHARALLGLPTPQAQINALQTILASDLNVRQTEDLVKRLNGIKPTPQGKPAISPELQALEDQLSENLGTKISLRPAGNGGTLTIHYYSNEELEAISDKLLK